VQVSGEGSIGVGADIDGAIVVVILGNRDPLGSGELLFQVTGNGLLLFPSEGGAIASPTPSSIASNPRRWRRPSAALDPGGTSGATPTLGDEEEAAAAVIIDGAMAPGVAAAARARSHRTCPASTSSLAASTTAARTQEGECWTIV
jgi:hypothetical protein